MPAYRPIAERLADLSERDATTGCVEWKGCLDKCGYGKVMGGKDLPGETLAHRAAYRVWVGDIPDGTEIDHSCRNRRCINPAHLQAITHEQNVALADYSQNHRNAVKTHCKRGHPFTEENTVIEMNKGRPRRKCRECRKAYDRRRSAMHPMVKIVEV